MAPYQGQFSWHSLLVELSSAILQITWRLNHEAIYEKIKIIPNEAKLASYMHISKNGPKNG